MPDLKQVFGLFRAPYAVYCKPSFLSLVIANLESHLRVHQASESEFEQSNVLNLIHVLQANLECMTACGLKPTQILTPDDLEKLEA